MAAKNFHVAALIDGRTAPLTGGPAAADGGFKQNIFIRDRGNVRKALSVFGEVEGELLFLRVLDEDGEEIYRVEARR